MKKMIAILSALVVAAALAYIPILKAEPAYAGTDSTSSAVLIEDLSAAESDSASEQIYAPLINEYQRVLNGEKLNTSIMKQSQTGFVNCHCGLCRMESGVLKGFDDCSMNLNYAIYDFNQDGIDEIIFNDTAYSNGTDDYDIYSIWTNDGQKPVFLTTAEYRNRVTVTRDGLIKSHYSGGWQTDATIFYELYGGALYNVAGFSHDGSDYYLTEEFEEPTSKAEYTEAYAQYDTGTLTGLTWTRINANKTTPKASKYAVTKFKIGGKDYSKKFKKFKDKKDKGVKVKKQKIKNKKLVIKTGKGWKIKRIAMEWPVGEGVSSKTLKNNKKFSAPKNYYIEVTLVNKYTGRTVYRSLYSY